MRFRAIAVALGLGALAATPCLALTIQSAPPRPDVVQYLRPAGPASTAPRGSYLAPGRPQLGLGPQGPVSTGISSFSFGPVRATTTVTPHYGDVWNDGRRRDSGNPLSLTPRRP